MNLNPQQQEVVSSVNGVYVVIAGPGSGKTRCMVERLYKMISLGIPLSDTLFLTFTSSAAVEAAERTGIVNAEKIFRTFHSFALELIKKERAHVPFPLTDAVIPTRGEDFQLIYDLVKLHRVRSFKDLQGKISEWKRSGVTPDQAVDEAIGADLYYAEAYKDYETKCRQQGWLDFDSLIYETIKLLETNEDVRNRHKKKYISVDECQDTDINQFKLLKLLFTGNIMVVGDENQLIYEWRSAQPGNLSNFSRSFPGAKVLYLGQNYRSTAELVAFFRDILPEDNGIASHMVCWLDALSPEQQRAAYEEKKLQDPNFTTSFDEWIEEWRGTGPQFINYVTSDMEIGTVIELACQDPQNSAIISRTNHTLFKAQLYATERGIKYKNLGNKDFWEQREVQALLDYAKEFTSSQNAAEVLNQIIATNNLYYRFRNSGGGMSDPIQNLNDVVRLAKTKNMAIKEFCDYINRLKYGRRSRKDRDLTFATVHQAKGREWKNVYVINAAQGVMPHQNGEIKEEKRIFFVACSRAARNLQVSWCGPKTEFLSDFDHEYVYQKGQ